MNNELKKLLEGKTDVNEIARVVAEYTKRTSRKRSTQAERREWLHGIINHARKMTPEQMTAVVWEYAMYEAGSAFAAWLGRYHKELFQPVVKRSSNDVSTSDTTTNA